MLHAGANLEIWMMVDWIGIKTSLSRLKIFVFLVFQNSGLNYGRVDLKFLCHGFS